MATGTRFSTKDGLISSITKKIYTNTKFEVSADKIQTAIRDVIESLWDKRPNILVINDANISQYMSVVESFRPIVTIPVETDILVFETSGDTNLFGIRMSGDFYNGKKLKVTGRIRFWQPDDYSLLIQGRMSRYYYAHTYSPVSNNDGRINQIFECFSEFIYWNGAWFGEWY